MKDYLKELLEVRNLIAILVALVFVVLSFLGKIDTENVMTIILLVFGFLFGNMATKDKM